MFSQCPHCQFSCYLTADQLKTGLGRIRCEHCGAQFNALESISDKPANPPPLCFEERLSSPLLKAIVRSYCATKPITWAFATVLAFSVLGLQLYRYEFHFLSQQPNWRQGLQSVCHLFGCRLPEYRNLNELSVLESKFVLEEDASFWLNTTILNQAVFSQPLPSIKLNLLDYNGNTMAFRVFKPADYLNTTDKNHLEKNASFNIRLHLAPVDFIIAGFNIELV